jgi:hypothetical protein
MDITFPITSDDSIVEMYEDFLTKHPDVKLAVIGTHILFIYTCIHNTYQENVSSGHSNIYRLKQFDKNIVHVLSFFLVFVILVF